MSDETLVADDEVEEVVEPEAPSTDEAEVAEEEVVEELEFNFQGKKLRVPKASVPEELAQEMASFVKETEGLTTRKLQEIADQRKALEAQTAAVQKLTALSGEAQDAYARGLAVKAELEALSKEDLNALWQSDPDQARRVSDEISTKRAEFGQIVNQVDQHERAVATEQASQTAQFEEQGKARVLEAIPDFEAKAPEVIEYAVKTYGSLGVTKEAAEQWSLNPSGAIMAYKAMLYDRLQAKASNTKVTPVEAKPVKPVAKRVGGNASAAPKDSDSPEEWRRKRDLEVRKRMAG